MLYIFNKISNLQPGGLKDHEKQHVAHGHVPLTRTRAYSASRGSTLVR